MKQSLTWRALFAIGAVLILYGGPQHPRATMLEMLRDPIWVAAHAWVTAGFVAFWAGLWVWGRALVASPTLLRWWRWSMVVTALECIEWVFHTAAAVDADRLAAGEATPVLTTHLWMGMIVHPIFMVVVGGLIWIAAREGRLGSLWIAPIAIFGLVCHGMAYWLAGVLQIEGARILFPMMLFFAIWMLLAALWPIRPRNAEAA